MTRTSSAWRYVSTSGYTNIRVSAALAGEGLDNGEFCTAEVTVGSSTTTLATITSSSATGVYTVVNPAQAITVRALQCCAACSRIL